MSSQPLTISPQDSSPLSNFSFNFLDLFLREISHGWQNIGLEVFDEEEDDKGGDQHQHNFETASHQQ